MACCLIEVIPICGMEMGILATAPNSMLGFFAFEPKPKGRPLTTWCFVPVSQPDIERLLESDIDGFGVMVP
jgi:hypothetical protein